MCGRQGFLTREVLAAALRSGGGVEKEIKSAKTFQPSERFAYEKPRFAAGNAGLSEKKKGGLGRNLLL
jgi:hypothetical protein